MDGDSASMAFGVSGHHTVVPHLLLGPQCDWEAFGRLEERGVVVEWVEGEGGVGEDCGEGSGGGDRCGEWVFCEDEG